MKMKMKSFLSVLLGLAMSASLLAQQNNPGYVLMKLGELELAKQHFMKVMRQQPANSFYYLGEIAWEEGNIAEAKSNYAKALESNPESPYSQIGGVKAKMHGLSPDSKEMKDLKKELENIYKKNKKDVPLVLEAAKAFYDNNLVSEGDKAVQEARKSDKSNPLIYILEGDRMHKAGKMGDAAMQYDQALTFDENNVIALVKSGKVYENINPKLAIEQYEKAAKIDANNKLIDRYLAKLYSSSGRYEQAIEIYAPYFMNNNFNIEDIRYFSRALYFNKKYGEAKEILQLGLEREPNDFVFNRLMMYTENELKNEVDGLKVAEHFFSLRAEVDSGYIEQDFTTYGHLLTKAGKQPEAIAAYEKAIEINPEKITMYRDFASTMAEDKLYEDAAEFYKRYIEKAGDAANEVDYTQMGKHYQSAALRLNNDTLPESVSKRQELLKKADAAFEVVTEKKPDNYIAFFYRASVNALLDPEIKEGLAKPFYERALEIITENDELEQRKSVVFSIYQYLAIYNLYKFDDTSSADYKTEALKYCDLALDIKPEDASITQIKDILLQQ